MQTSFLLSDPLPPRQESGNGDSSYYYEWKDEDNRTHREGEPAIVGYWADKTLRSEEYLLHGSRHRKFEPAVILLHENGKVHEVQYWYEGNLHREDGSAITIWDDEGNVVTRRYYLKGQKVSAQDIQRLSAKRIATGDIPEVAF